MMEDIHEKIHSVKEAVTHGGHHVMELKYKATCALSVLFWGLMEWVSKIDWWNMRIPPIVTDVMRLMAIGVTIAAGLLGIYHTYVKKHRIKK